MADEVKEKDMKEKMFKAKEYNNFKELIKESTKKYKENTEFVIKEKDGTKTNITYEKLSEDINNLGIMFYIMGLENKRTAIIGKNQYAWVVTHLANQLGGIVSVPLDKDLQYDELENSLIRSKAECIVFDQKLIPQILKIQENNKTNICTFICMNENEQGFLSIPEIINKGKEYKKNKNSKYMQKEKEYDNVKIDNNKMSILLFTSGTTSKSKAVMLSQNNIASNVYAMQLVENFYETDVNLAFLPFHHIFGSTEMIVMLACGLATAFPDGLRYVAQNLKEYKVSVFVGVPLLIEAIYKKIEQGIEKQGKAKLVNSTIKLSNFLLKVFHIDIRRKLFKTILNELGGHMRFIISGGAPLDKKVAKRFNELGIDLVQGYGLTETSPVIAAENYKKVKYGSIGVPMDNVDIEFENKDENGIGELKVKGPNVMLGYYENPEATKEVLKNGWFYTGDLGYIDKQGYIFITGRKKDMIVLKNGKKVFPEELEVLINRLEEVKECMVFGMPDNKDKNDVKLTVKVVYDTNIIETKYPNIEKEELEKIIWEKIKEINKTFPPYKYIKNMILTDKELIKTTTKKIKRNEEMRHLGQV